MRVHYTVLAILEISVIVKSEWNFTEWTDPLKGKKKKKAFCECYHIRIKIAMYIPVYLPRRSAINNQQQSKIFKLKNK